MAIKVVQARDTITLERLIRECELLKTLDHPNIVKYYGCVTHVAEREASIFMELMPHSLATSYCQFGPLAEPVLRRYISQILSALCYLHSHERRIIHGDLKAANLLYDGRHVKLTDFGDAHLLSTAMPSLSGSNSGVIFKEIGGSLLWMAPEVIRETPTGTRSDIWSLGQLVIELASGARPWPQIRDLADLFERLRLSE